MWLIYFSIKFSCFNVGQKIETAPSFLLVWPWSKEVYEISQCMKYHVRQLKHWWVVKRGIFSWTRLCPNFRCNSYVCTSDVRCNQATSMKSMQTIQYYLGHDPKFHAVIIVGWRRSWMWRNHVPIFYAIFKYRNSMNLCNSKSCVKSQFWLFGPSLENLLRKGGRIELKCKAEKQCRPAYWRNEKVRNWCLGTEILMKDNEQDITQRTVICTIQTIFWNFTKLWQNNYHHRSSRGIW